MYDKLLQRACLHTPTMSIHHLYVSNYHLELLKRACTKPVVEIIGGTQGLDPSRYRSRDVNFRYIRSRLGIMDTPEFCRRNCLTDATPPTSNFKLLPRCQWLYGNHYLSMDNGEPLLSYEGLAAAFAKAKAEKEREEAQGLRGSTQNAEADNKQGEVRFKASHGLLMAFFGWLLYEIPSPIIKA